jgi:hypothetical protein
MQKPYAETIDQRLARAAAAAAKTKRINGKLYIEQGIWMSRERKAE